MSATRWRIVLVAPPFAGHLHPILGLARALATRHTVEVWSTAAAQPAIRAAGLSGRELLAGADPVLRQIVDPPYRIGSNPLRLNRQLRLNFQLMTRFRGECHALLAAEPPDLLIADFTLPVAGRVARSLGIRWWTTHPSPCVIETADGPPAYLGGWIPARSMLGRCRERIGRRLVRGFKRLVGCWYRRPLAALGIAGLHRADGSEALYSDDHILALGLESLEFASRWPAAVRFVGPVLYTPPRPLAGADARQVTRPPRVLVTLGTHLRWHKDAAVSALAQVAAALPDHHIDFSDGDPQRGDQRLAPNLRRLGYVPYDSALGHYDLVVHHGGAGVLYSTLAAGKPAIVYPLDYDQFDHAARLQVRGLACRIKRLQQLVERIPAVLADHALRARCAAMRVQIEAGNAGQRVLELIDQAMAADSRSPAALE